MKKNLLVLLSLLVAVSMMLTACNLSTVPNPVQGELIGTDPAGTPIYVVSATPDSLHTAIAGTQTQAVMADCATISQQIVGEAEWIGGNFKLTLHAYPAAGCPIQRPLNWKVEVDGFGIALGQFSVDPNGQDFLATEKKIASDSTVVIYVDDRQFLAVPDQTLTFDFIVQE